MHGQSGPVNDPETLDSEAAAAANRQGSGGCLGKAIAQRSGVGRQLQDVAGEQAAIARNHPVTAVHPGGGLDHIDALLHQLQRGEVGWGCGCDQGFCQAQTLAQAIAQNLIWSIGLPGPVTDQGDPRLPAGRDAGGGKASGGSPNHHQVVVLGHQQQISRSAVTSC